MASGTVPAMTTTLRSYIEAIGDAAAATLFHVSERRAKSWRLGTRLPKPGKAKAMVEATGGKLTMEGIYADVPATDKE